MQFASDLTLQINHSEKHALLRHRRYVPVGDRLAIRTQVLSGDGKAGSPYKLHVAIRNDSDRVYQGILRFELSLHKANGKIFMPAFMYGRNGGDRGRYSAKARYPHLGKGFSKCMSEYWQVRGDRLSHPIALAYVDKRVFGISSAPYYGMADGKHVFWQGDTDIGIAGYNGFYGSIEHGTCVGFTLGYENAPYTYILTPKYAGRTDTEDRYFTLAAHATVACDLYVYDYQAVCEHDVSDAIEDCYFRYRQLPRRRSRLQDAVQDIATAIMQDAYVPSRKNYATVVREKKGQIAREIDNLSIGWTGGAEIATPLLMAAVRLQDDAMRSQALACIDHIVQHSMNPRSGLPYDAYNTKNGWTEKGWWYSGLKVKGHHVYVIAQAVFYILKAYETEKSYADTLHADWLAFSEKVLDRILLTQDKQGGFPYVFSVRDGSGIEYAGFAGCWCYAAMAYYAYLTGTDKYDRAMNRANAYYAAFVRAMECYGTPPDTYLAADSEGILAFIKASRLRHAVTQDMQYLRQMDQAFRYEFSFQFAYNTKLHVPPLSKQNWSSSGGCVTSVCNPHIHPMSNNIIDDMLYYLAIQPNAYIQSRLWDRVLWGLQTYNSYDGEFDYGKRGWMSERFCYSEGLLLEKYADGTKSSVWFAFLPWGAANVLEGMCGDLWQNAAFAELTECDRCVGR